MAFRCYDLRRFLNRSSGGKNEVRGAISISEREERFVSESLRRPYGVPESGINCPTPQFQRRRAPRRVPPLLLQRSGALRPPSDGPPAFSGVNNSIHEPREKIVGPYAQFASFGRGRRSSLPSGKIFRWHLPHPGAKEKCRQRRHQKFTPIQWPYPSDNFTFYQLFLDSIPAETVKNGSAAAAAAACREEKMHTRRRNSPAFPGCF